MADSPALDPALGPFSAEGGSQGVLLLHGFTGSPASMTPWGRFLAGEGFTVRVPRLPGHGTTWREMNRTRWTDWYAEAERSLEELTARCDQVVVGGLSMGGCLALRLAEQRPDDVDALVLVNPAVHLVDRRLLAVPLLRHVLASMPGIGNDISKPGADERGYDRVPLHALHSQMQMWRAVRADLARVTQPLLLLRSVQDHVLDPSSARMILDGVSSGTSREQLLENSFHVATLDHDADTIHEAALSFVREHLGAHTAGHGEVQGDH